ncbi:hypothetical protein [Salinimonas sediminis]|uniref:Uncharacterized protein n=1 Tax=Salinimonas sediminis TaxID=2303538 RepID=A0A346NMJ8_9ALTE|nr:hypothetical protein [Salinimonas sediminis]AXR06755.1 hypothetical protein D0Y50_10500 [Salinimonas sediminis]
MSNYTSISLEELNVTQCAAVGAGTLTLRCCSVDISIMTLSWDGFEITIGADFNAGYGKFRGSAYNRL